MLSCQRRSIYFFSSRRQILFLLDRGWHNHKLCIITVMPSLA